MTARSLGRTQRAARSVGLVVAVTLAGGFVRALVGGRRGPTVSRTMDQVYKLILLEPSTCIFTRLLSGIRHSRRVNNPEYAMRERRPRPR